MSRPKPEHDTDYGEAGDGIHLYGVGEFAPDSVAPGTPVFLMETEAGSYITFAFLPDEAESAYMRVFHAHSEERGEFRRLMDKALSHFQGAEKEPKEVVFANVVSEMLPGRDLEDVLDGFERFTVEVEYGPDDYLGDEFDELVGTWDPRRS